MSETWANAAFSGAASPPEEHVQLLVGLPGVEYPEELELLQRRVQHHGTREACAVGQGHRHGVFRQILGQASRPRLGKKRLILLFPGWLPEEFAAQLDGAFGAEGLERLAFDDEYRANLALSTSPAGLALPSQKDKSSAGPA